MHLNFFVQAKDGIRGAQESRGLGDVYKRQVEDLQACETKTVTVPLGQFASNGDVEFFAPVPYTHLTLPTIHTV